jgi:hypothetical protein
MEKIDLQRSEDKAVAGGPLPQGTGTLILGWMPRSPVVP